MTKILPRQATNALSAMVADLTESKVEHVLIGVFPDQGGFRTVASASGDKQRMAHGLGEKLLEMLRNPNTQEIVASAIAGALHRSPFKSYLHPNLQKRYDGLAKMIPDSKPN